MDRSFFSKILHRLGRAEKRIIVFWIRFSRKHRDSHRLPFFLFAILFLDGFTMVIPSLFCMMASVTISPRRWILFGTIFAAAATSNNLATYILGRCLPTESIVNIIEYFQMEAFWQMAERALHDYGSYATFIGAIIGLPTQMILMLIGIADAQLLQADPSATASFYKAIIFAFLGHSLKGYALAALTRYGWVKLEKKFGTEVVPSSPKP